MKPFSLKLSLLFFCLSLSFPAAAQFTASGTEPASVKWESFRTENYRLIYPVGLDSLARCYAAALESFRVPNSVSSGFLANEFYKTTMTAVLHSYTGYSNGSVSWAPRNLSLYTNPDSNGPEWQPWIDQLAVHEGRHVAQMQLGNSAGKFKVLSFLTGEMSAGVFAGIYSGPAFLEGDAVVAETVLSDAGRGRSADFLSYYRASFADSLYRDYWKWVFGSQRRYTPDYYRAGYMMHAGMRYTFNKPDFTKYYYQRIIHKPLFPFRNLQKSIKEVSGLKLKRAFRQIEDDFAADWAANDSLRLSLLGEFIDGEDVTPAGRYYNSYKGITILRDSIYAVRSGLDRLPQLVRISNDGSVKALHYMGSGYSRLAADEAGGKLFWTELRADRRWEKKSSSRLVCFDVATGKTKTLSGPDDRYYNPAASDSDSLLAVVSNRLDGRTELLVLSSGDGSLVQSFLAPDGMQLVEPAWLDGRLYASAITDGGFGIFRIDDWSAVLAPEAVKISRLFGKDGRLWFSSDRDGTTELYSVGGDGRLLQETTLRLGGNEWTFAGNSLLYTSVRVNDNGVKALPVSSLLGTPVPSDPLPRPIPEKLSRQEDTLALSSGRTMKRISPEELETSEPKPYKKAANLFRTHSWAPIYVDSDVVSEMSFENIYTDGGLGATVWFQNEIESSYGQIGVEFPLGNIPALHLQWVYAGWTPVIELNASVGGRSAVEQNYDITVTDSTISMSGYLDSLATPVVTGTAKIYFPINLSSGGWTRGIIPSFTVAGSNDLIAAVDYKNKSVFQYKAPQLIMKAALRGYTMLGTVPSGIFPRFGIGAEIGVLDKPLHRVWLPATAYAQLYGYLPGFCRTDGWRYDAFVSQNFGGHWSSERNLSASIEYAVPFASVDWSGLAPLTYIRNFELHLHGSYSYTGITSEISGNLMSATQEAYVGASLQARLGTIWGFPFEGRVGIKYLYNPIDPSLSGVSGVFTVDI